MSTDEISFRVNFEPSKNIQESDMKLTFFGPSDALKIDQSTNFLHLIKKALESTDSGYRISNIKDVIPNSENFKPQDFSGYIVLLFTNIEEINQENDEKDNKEKKKSFKRQGLLLGNSMNHGYEVLGVWPYSYFADISTSFEQVSKKLDNLIKDPSKLTDILVITQK